jgi:hypothetical protein
LRSRGAILISNIEFERAKYITTLRKIIPSVKVVPDETIILQFEEFLVRLEKVVRNKKNDDLNSKELIKLFIKGIDMIIHSICVSAVKISVESVIESLT